MGPLSMRRRLATVGACAIATFGVVWVPHAGADDHRDGGAGRSSTVAVYGDSPYGTSNADTAQFGATPAFIGTINADPDVSGVLHIGDIHSGKQFCTQAYDQ